MNQFDDYVDLSTSDTVKQGGEVSGESVPRDLEQAQQQNQQLGTLPQPDLSSQAPQQEPAQAPSAPEPRLQKRLTKLLGQKSELQGENTLLQQELELMKQQNELLRQQMQTDRTIPVTGAPAGAGFEPQPTTVQPDTVPSWAFQHEGQTQANPAVGRQAAQIGEMLKQELAPVRQFMESYQEQEANRSRALQVQQAQAQSFQSAVEEFPELQDRNSRLFQVANELASRDSGLQGDPEGPYKAAIMARGLLADDAKSGLQEQSVRQAAASINRPSGIDTGAPVANDAVQRYNEAMNTLKTSKDPAAWIRARKAQREANGAPEPTPG